MALVVPLPNPQEEAWRRGEAETVDAMGAINAATARLCDTIAMLDATNGWGGWGIRSLVHWVCWKANLREGRAKGLVRIAKRRGELPVCFGMFREGRLTEDAMRRIAERVPASRDAEVASWAANFTYSQLARVLRTLPEVPDPDARPKADPQRYLRMRDTPEGYLRGEFSLPPEEGAALKVGLTAGRDAVFRDRNDLDPDAEVGRPAGVDWADGLVRLAEAGTDQLDATLQRTGRVGTRHLVVLHHDIDADGSPGPGMVDNVHVPDAVARYLACDAQTVVNLYADGKLIGITPTVREPSRALRRALERRDGGCAHPLCSQRRWLHLHHLRFWENGGLTTPSNLLCLCPEHHRGLHRGDFTITGNPEERTIVFRDRHGRVIGPPVFGPPGPATGTTTYTPPTGERLDPRWFGWN